MSIGQKDIARILGVTQATVSRALSGKTGVSEDVRKKILEFCEERGYHPDFAGRGLSSGRTGVVSLIKNDMYLGDVHGPWAAALHTALRGHGLRLRLDTSDDFANILAGRSADGFIVFNYAEDFPEPVRQAMLNSDRPVIHTDCPSGTCASNTIAMDSEGGMEGAVMYLADLGHERIAFVGLISGIRVAQARYRGYLKALESRGLATDVPVVGMAGWPGDYSDILVHSQAVKECLDAGATAFVATTDLIALAVMRMAGSWGYRVPEDVSVIGYDDSMVSRISEIPLTTVSQNILLASKAAGDMMYGLITNGGVPIPSVDIPHPLVIRETTAAVRR